MLNESDWMIYEQSPLNIKQESNWILDLWLRFWDKNCKNFELLKKSTDTNRLNEEINTEMVIWDGVMEENIFSQQFWAVG